MRNLQSLLQYKEGIKRRFENSFNKGIGTFMAENVLLKPKSRGTIRLQSSDPMDPPLIDPNYLDHPDDIKTLLKGKEKLFVFETHW
jgi:choline dehydrogenase-like flavoprotein